LIFSLIDHSASSPVTSPEDSDHSGTVGETDRQNAVANLTETEIPGFYVTVGKILGNDAVGVGEGKLRFPERDAMLLLVLSIFPWIPLEARTAHALSLENPGPDCHMNIWELRTVMRGLADWTLSQHGQVGLARRAKPDGLASLRTRPVAALRA